MAEPKRVESPQASDDQLPQPSTSTPPTLDQAQKFLRDENVKSASREKKTDFLKSKGFTDGDVQKLLNAEPSEAEPAPTNEDEAPANTESKDTPRDVESQTTSPPPPSAPSSSTTPPIITYPEFLTHSPKPPPLLTPTRLLNTATVLTTAWTLAYGVARFLVNPMVETLSESRSDYYAHVSQNLSTLVGKLEGVVSEVPYKNGKPLKSEADVDDDSSYGDPTEMFHRDFGTQTSPLTSAVASPVPGEKTVEQQASHLAQLTSSLKELSDTYVSQAENSGNLHLSLREFRENVDKLAYPSGPEYSSLYGGSGFGMGRSSEPEDEIKKTKDAIRSVKGMFLSSRMFPAVTAAR